MSRACVLVPTLRCGERNDVQAMATLRSLAWALPSAQRLNALRLGGFWSITHGLDALAGTDFCLTLNEPWPLAPMKARERNSASLKWF
jgi:hypothetical protein